MVGIFWNVNLTDTNKIPSLDQKVALDYKNICLRDNFNMLKSWKPGVGWAVPP